MKELIKYILQEYLNEQRVPRGYWNPETLKQEAEKYKSEGEFILKSSSAYQTARRMGILDYVLQNLEKTDRKKYTKDEVAKEALKYSNRNAFKKGSKSYYRAAIAHKWIDDVSKHMESPYKSWGKEDVEKEALKYNYSSEFEYNSPKAYGAAQYHGWLSDVTSHMGKLGSIKKRMVYAYEFSDNYAYIGLTYHKDKRNDQHMKSGPVYKHIQETGLTPIRIEISDYIDAQDASKLEQSTENKYRNEGWNILNQAKPGVLGGSTPIWTPETVKKESLKYQTVKDFRLGSPKAYNAANRNGWVPELGLIDTDVRWDYESVSNLAKKYKTRKEFSNNNNGAYQFAIRNKILDDITKHMDVKQIKWTKELAAQEALNYKTRNEFAKGSKKAYDAANKYRWLDDITKHMVLGINTHSKDEIQKIADNYEDHSKFVKEYPHLSQYARKKGWIDIFQHMIKKKVWTPDELQIEALKYDTMSDFKNNNKNAYQAAYRKGILDDITKHMNRSRTIWTKDLIYQVASKYKSRSEFERGNASAYLAAKRDGYIDDLFPNPKSKGHNQWTKLK
jgi:hypothetical protein